MKIPTSAHLHRHLFIVFLAVGLTGCGGGGDGGSGEQGSVGAAPPPAPPPVAVPAPTANAISLRSDAGDSIGLGKSYGYSSSNSKITLTERAGRLTITVDGDEHWTADFLGPDAQSPLHVGTFQNLSQFPVVDPAIGAFRWYGEGRGCTVSTGSVTIDQVSYRNSLLESITLRFERHCDGASAALRGEVQWTSADHTVPPSAINPPPPGLWSPAPGSTPASGNYVLLEGDFADVVSLGQTHLYTDADTAINVGGTSIQAFVSVYGNEQWAGTFQSIDGKGLAPGYFPNLRGMPFYNPVRGGLSWTGEGRGCVSLKGWFIIDRVTYANNVINGIDLRFEQGCDGSSAVLHGAVHWNAPPDLSANPPATLMAAGSWHAPAAALPANGNYLYLASGAGDAVGAGRTTVATPLDAVFSVKADLAHLHIEADGVTHWFGDFQAPAGQASLQAGVYDGLTRFGIPGSAPLGSLSWIGASGCSPIRGWLAIDRVTYVAGVLVAVDLRFEQACDLLQGTLKGQLHWSADDARIPQGPMAAVPAPLWRPAVGSTPGVGNYVHLESDRGDAIGAGIIANYTQADSVLKIVPSGAGITIDIAGEQKWTANVQPMVGLARLQPGYYPGLNGTPPHNPAKGGFSFYGEARGCNTSLSSFVVDDVSYVVDTLATLDLRFEQHCEGTRGSALRGAIHWTNSDPITPPGPVNPPPELWRPPPGATADAGTYVYLQSDPGDFIGDGLTTTAMAPSSQVAVSTRFDGAVVVEVSGATQATGDFLVMSSRARLEPGYYGQLQRYPFGNPARGSMSWSSSLHGCNTLQGWFIVDSVSYVGDVISSLDLRFEQHCEGAEPALRGRVRWNR